MNANTTGSFIASLRQERGMTQRELAQELLVSDKAVSKWETGRGLPDIENLEALAGVFDVSMAELLRGERIEETIDADTADDLAAGGLELARQLLRRRSVSNALLGFLAGVVLVTLVAIHLTSPITLTWREGLVRVEELSDGTLVAMADDGVASMDADVVDGQAFVSCHSSRWDQMTGHDGGSLVPLGNKQQVEAVLYYPGTPDDVLVYGEMDAAGVVTLPRLVYNYWLVIGIVTSVAGLVAYALLRKRWFARHILRAALLPACLGVSLVAVLWGRFGEVYNAAYYLSGICMLGLALWATCLVVLDRRGSVTRKS